jgi:hypothetical protein
VMAGRVLTAALRLLHVLSLPQRVILVLLDYPDLFRVCSL